MAAAPDDQAPPKQRVGRPSTIRLDEIVAAAGEIGLRDVSMSAVARRLGVTTAALYGHVDGLDDLRDRVATAIVDTFEIPDPGTDLDGVAIRFATRLRRMVVAHPGLAEHLMHSTPTAGYDQYKLMHREFVERGLDAHAARLIVEELVGFTLGYDLISFRRPPEDYPDPPTADTYAPDGSIVPADDLFAWAVAAYVAGLLDAIDRGVLPWA